MLQAANGSPPELRRGRIGLYARSRRRESPPYSLKEVAYIPAIKSETVVVTLTSVEDDDRDDFNNLTASEALGRLDDAQAQFCRLRPLEYFTRPF
jgi:hypothetical protein